METQLVRHSKEDMSSKAEESHSFTPDKWRCWFLLKIMVSRTNCQLLSSKKCSENKRPGPAVTSAPHRLILTKARLQRANRVNGPNQNAPGWSLHMCFKYQSEMFTVKCGWGHFDPALETLEIFEFQAGTQEGILHTPVESLYQFTTSFLYWIKIMIGIL